MWWHVSSISIKVEKQEYKICFFHYTVIINYDLIIKRTTLKFLRDFFVYTSTYTSLMYYDQRTFVKTPFRARQFMIAARPNPKKITKHYWNHWKSIIDLQKDISNVYGVYRNYIVNLFLYLQILYFAQLHMKNNKWFCIIFVYH